MFIYILATAPEREDTCIVRTLKFIDPCLQIIRNKYPSDPKRVTIRIFVPVRFFKHFSEIIEIKPTLIFINIWYTVFSILLFLSIYSTATFNRCVDCLLVCFNWMFLSCHCSCCLIGKRYLSQ